MLALRARRLHEENAVFSTISTYAFYAGTASLAVVGVIFVAVMSRYWGDRKILGWKKKVLHPAPYLRFTGISYAVAAGAYVLSEML